MDRFAHKLNELLVDTYRQISKIEEQAIHQTGRTDLSISELHLLEAVGKDKEKGRTISDIAQSQGITLPSVTAAVNKLVKKGYVEKVKALHDGRVVYVKLTRLGRKMDAGHRYFHENMVRNVSLEMSEEEREALVRGIDKLNRFLGRKLEAADRDAHEIDHKAVRGIVRESGQEAAGK